MTLDQSFLWDFALGSQYCTCTSEGRPFLHVAPGQAPDDVLLPVHVVLVIHDPEVAHPGEGLVDPGSLLDGAIVRQGEGTLEAGGKAAGGPKEANEE